MTSFATSSLRLLRRLVHAHSGTHATIPGTKPITLDGMSAIALTEAMVSSCASLGSTFPASIGARRWHDHGVEGEQCLDKSRLGTVESHSGRGALAGAIGFALSGERATAFLSGPDLLAAQDVLATAAGRHVPLVIHLVCRSTAAHGQAIGSGHEAYHAAADQGCFQLFATNAQEAVDFALIARQTAERALVPGIVAMDGDQTALADQNCVLPDADLVREFLGGARDEMSSPTPAQRLIHGEKRRRVPRGFSTDQPAMLGALHSTETFALGLAGRRPYFDDHVAPILKDSFEVFAQLTGRTYSCLFEHDIEQADTIFVVQGSAVETLIAFVDRANRQQHKKLGLLGLRCLRPALPNDQIRALAGKKTIVVFERVDTPLAHEGPLIRELRAAFSRAAGDQVSPAPRFINVIYGLGGLPLREADLQNLQNVIDDSSRSPLYLGLSFTRDASEYPKQQALIDAIRRGHREIGELGIRATKADGRGVQNQLAIEATEPPIGHDSGVGAVESLARWWDEVAFYTESGKTDELIASPAFAEGKIPAKSSILRNVSASRTKLPALDPSACDGHPSLWTTCPDASLVPLVISSRSLIESGIEIAGREGKSADALRAIVAPLAKRINKIVASSETLPTTIRPILHDAFEQVSSKSDMPDDRRASLRDAIDALAQCIGDLPVARTNVFFDEPESRAPGTGELFSIIVNPYTCKCPELVEAVCGAHGVELVDQTPDSLDKAQCLYRLWEQLPDTSGETIERARKHEKIGELAGVMLSRHCLLAMAGGDGAEAASGAKLALRHLLGLAEFHLQPRQQQLLERIDNLREQLGERIRSMLTDALPTEDLDALARGIEQLGSQDLRLSELAGRLDTAVTGGSISGDQLAELVDTSRALADLRWKISSGPSGLGRARSGMILTPGAVSRWAGTFPNNPFQQPVVVDAVGESTSLALGLMEGQLRQVLSAIRLLRRAEIELKSPPDAREQIERLASLRFDQLTAEERTLCPPLFLVGDGRSAGGNGLSAIAHVLDSNLPVRVVLLTGAGGSVDDGFGVEAMDPFPNTERFDSAFLALLSRSAFVAQTSIGAPDHFARSTLDALAFNGPALLHIHTPSPERHGFPVDKLFDQAKLAIRSRAFPLFTFNPQAQGVFGRCLDLTGNPNLTSRWVLDTNDKPITPVDWMASEGRYSRRLHAASGDDRELIPVHEFFDLAPSQRADQQPFVVAVRDDKTTKLIVDQMLMADAENRLQFWRTLQEIAGIVTPFTDQVRKGAEDEVRGQHQLELDQLRSDYDARMNDLRAQFEADAVTRVTRGLLALSGYSAADERQQNDPGDNGT